ncbi:hypothetical protein LTS18_011188 [Coniosporium uncinatum]|uniref:Uncharacterized protein n=1 Tax=Coniosporium uncinatum TaxID=93489 RepID=A0ACC3DKG6_9PEZI|nr:hypothetical protein LTS18_011188 [Coniosporium uncinatum]
MNSQRSPAKFTSAPQSTPPRNNRTILNLLDFELPPAPTPRSIPSITVRELESLKSEYLSQISSLKATLSGREAEVDSLKRAVSDAERRVGEAQECVREERSRREHVEKEKSGWEARGREVEDVLRTVKAEVMASESEREELVKKLDDAERKVENAEQSARDAEARAAEAESKVLNAPTVTTVAADGQEAKGLYTAEQVQKQIDEKVHTLSTELHAIYKKKHVTKVAGLKKGFEAKTVERTAELQCKLEELKKANEELQAKVDGTLSGVTVMPASLGGGMTEEDRKRLEDQNARIEEQKAAMARLLSELSMMKQQYDVLMRDLEKERVEKGELVAAVDEMLLLQSDESTAGQAVEDFRKSIRSAHGPPAAASSGLKRPGFGFGGDSRIGAPTGLGRSVSGSKSRMMSNIERMGGRNVEY